MKLSLGMIFYNEAAMLRKLLPLYVDAFDAFFAVDTGSADDSCDIVVEHGAKLRRIAYKTQGESYNALISFVEENTDGYLFIVDADEGLLASDIHAFRDVLDGNCFSFPRLEFIRDVNHINSVFYPDFQSRCFPLRVGYHYRGILHAPLWYKDDAADVAVVKRVVKIPWLHIYHYGKLKSNEEIALHYENFTRLRKGQPRISKPSSVPSTFSIGPEILYPLPHPLCM